MSNMSYCRFRNTLKDLRDCLDNIEDELSPDEHKARKELIDVCVEIVNAAAAYGALDLPNYSDLED